VKEIPERNIEKTTFIMKIFSKKKLVDEDP